MARELKIGTCGWNFRELTIEEYLAEAARLGFRYVEIHASDRPDVKHFTTAPAADDLERLRRAERDTGVKAVAVATGLTYLNAEPQAVRENVAAAKALIDAAGAGGSAGNLPPLAGRNGSMTPLAAFGILMAGVICIAFAPTFSKLCKTSASGIAFWRVTLAIPFYWLWLLSDRSGARLRAARPSSKPLLMGLLLAGVFFAGDQAIWYASLKRTSAVNATLLVNFAPVFVAAGAWFWLRERFGGLFVAGLALALGGAYCVLSASFRISAQNLRGDVLALVAAVFYAGYILSIKRLRDHFAIFAIMAWSCIACSVALLLGALAFGESIWVARPGDWWPIVGLTLVCQIAGQGMIGYAMAHLSASFSSVSLLVQPVAVALIAWVTLGETLGRYQLVGGCLVLAGICLARRGSRATGGRPEAAETSRPST